MSNLTVMRKMIAFVAPLSGWMFIAVLTGVLGFLCAIGIPVSAAILLLHFFDIIAWFPPQNIVIFMMIIAIMRGVLHYIEQDCNHYIAFKLLAILRDRIFEKLRTLAPAKLEGKDKGNLISVITSDIELLEVFYAHTISPVFIGVLTSVCMLIIFYQLHFVFLLCALFFYVFVGFVLPIVIQKWGKETGDACRNGLGDLSAYSLESVRGIQDILQYQQERQRLEHLEKKTEQVNALQKKLRKYEGKTAAFTGASIQIAAIVTLILGIVLYQEKLIGFEHLVIATVLILSSFGPVIALANVANNLLLTLASGRRVLNLLNEEAVIDEVENGNTVELSDMIVDDVTFSYDHETTILDRVNAKIEKGKITGIFGKSGSGKSTLLKLMMRFWDPQKGKITMSDRNIKTISTKHLRSMQSFVTQDSILFQGTIEENLKIAKADATQEEMEHACKCASIHDFILSLKDGYQTNIEELGDSLSGGEKQRISIARAMLHPAEFILLDEPTSNLDALNEAIILKSLKELENRSIVLVSHRQSTMSICDQTIVMNEGRAS